MARITIQAALSYLLFGILSLTTGNAQPPQGTTLDEYVATSCSKNCVDTGELMEAVYAAGERYDLDPTAILAVIRVESSFDVKAKNGSSRGLTQVMISYHKKKFPTKDYYDVGDNIFAGAQVLRDCVVKHNGNYPKGFKCYNGYHQGDKKYAGKTSKALQEIRRLTLPPRQVDALGAFMSRFM